MKLVSVDPSSHAHLHALYDLLLQRRVVESISHSRVPSWEQHCRFVASQPYKTWLLITDDNDAICGSAYLTAANEIGIFIDEKHQRKGIGRWAVTELMQMHGSISYLANINPHNMRSIHLFESLGFAPHQLTLIKE